MCGDLNDPNSSQFGPALNFFGPSFGYDPNAAASNLSGTAVTVSELVVQPPQPTQALEWTDLGTMTIADFLPQQVMVPNVAIVSIPPLDFLVARSQPTPCVQHWPSAIDLETLNGAIVFSASMAYQNYLADGNEWGAIVYQTPDGLIHQSLPFTGAASGRIGEAHVPFPAGSVLLAWVHTHPPGSDQTTPSPNTQGIHADESFAQAVMSSGHGDPNLVTYIANKGSDGKMHIYAYDKFHLHNPPQGCEVQVQ